MTYLRLRRIVREWQFAIIAGVVSAAIVGIQVVNMARWIWAMVG